jgi:hypothetical protein
VLFSAHGLPERVIKAGDPYQSQVEQTAKAIVHALGGDLDWSVCYQSRVGPLKWIGPSTDAEITRAGADKVAVVLYPLIFVSEHSETLVELDIEYRHLPSRRRAELHPRADRRHASAVHPRAREAGSRRMLYEVLKALHIISVIAWMAGLRSFCRACSPITPMRRWGRRKARTFKVMERRLPAAAS